MKLQILVAAAISLASTASAHHVITNIIVGSHGYELGRCMRMPKNTDPLTDINSKDMACNINGDKGVARMCEATAGDSVTMQWRAWPDASQPGSVDKSHQGPCSAYLKKIPSGKSVTDYPGSGDGWFKIFDDGFRDGKFCATRLMENDGKMTFKLPTDLEAGEYLLRGEQVALHQAQNRGGAQFYVGCAQLLISSNGQKTKPATVSIPGYVKADDPGVLFNYWANTQPKNYQTPGPKLFSGSQQSALGAPKLKEKGDWNCALTRDNFCAKEVAPYTNETSCWKSVDACWKQVDVCYKTAPITGSKACKTLENGCTQGGNKCKQCKNGQCSGSFPVAPKK